MLGTISKCLLLFATLSNLIFYDASADTDTTIPLPTVQAGFFNFSELAESHAKPITVTMNGHHNYHAAQQIFYIYGPVHGRMQNNENLVRKPGSDYLVTPGMGAHKFHTRKLTWNRARRICIQEGGHLTIINSESEEKILVRMLEEANVEKAWLGFHDLFEEGDWVTVLDEPMESAGYSKWSLKFPNNPDNYGGKQNCAVLMKSSGMDDMDCASPQSFFCEIPA